MNISDTYLKRERLFAGIFLFIVSFTIARTIRHAAISYCGGPCPVVLYPPQSPWAPDVYRVGVNTVTRWINILFHFKDATIANIMIDFFSTFLGLGILYYLAVDGLSTLRETITARIATLGFFLAFIQFPIGFIYYQGRGETLPTVLFVAVALLCFSKAKDKSSTGYLWTLLLFAATAAQSFFRADVPFIVGVAAILLSLVPGALADLGSISGNLFRGAGVTLISGAIQAYLKWVRFPNAHYGSEHAIVLKLNLNATPLSLLALSLSPFVWMLILVIRRRIRLTSVEALILAASAIYLPIWFTVGMISEVRIFVPFLLALCVVAARVSAAYLLSKNILNSPDAV
jgi:hypothetical protein